jgi:glycosyltransferase involved in cell wall biosynthesis
MNLSVGFDAEKIKHPNTGLNTFCFQLALALQQECETMDDADFKVYLPPIVKNYFGGNIKEHIYRFYDRRLLFLPGRIWHQPFQGGKYFPRGVHSTLLTIHDLNYLYEKGGKYREREERIVQKRINRSDRIVAISEFTKNDILKNLDTQGKHIDVVYNGCSTYNGEIIPPKEIPDRPFLFNVGTILPKKNVHVLPAILRGNDYLLYIAGNHSNYEKEIWSKARKYGVENRIRIVGPVKEAEKHWYFKNCDAFLFPSIAEGFGLPVIEAMQYGKPCFLSRHTCLPEIGGDKAYYFNYEFDPDLMKQEFEEGMHHFTTQADRQTIIEHSQKYTWQKAAQAYWKIYREMAK